MIDKDKVVEIIGMYFYETDFNTMDVIAVDVGTEDYKSFVSLTTRHPGVLIGHHGKYIKALQEHISENLGFDVNVKIIEDTLWSKVPLYGEEFLED